MNMPIQGSAADVLKLAMLALREAGERRGARMILGAGRRGRARQSVHDELVFEVRRSTKSRRPSSRSRRPWKACSRSRCRSSSTSAAATTGTPRTEASVFLGCAQVDRPTELGEIAEHVGYALQEIDRRRALFLHANRHLDDVEPGAVSADHELAREHVFVGEAGLGEGRAMPHLLRTKALSGCRQQAAR